jgi:triosephosphate isomerase (TIM)
MNDKRKPLIAGNWKLNLSSEKGIELAKKLLSGLPSEGPEVAVFPTFLAAPAVAALLKGSRIGVGVQDIYFQQWGAFTGEISPAAALAEGIEWCLVGHSERRMLLGENDAIVARKSAFALSSGMKVVLCIGETLVERENMQTFAVLERQIKDGVLAAAPELHKDLVIAYEPVWAIGTGKTATPEIAQEAHYFIRSLLCGSCGSEKGNAIRILYGGSVTASNIKGLMEQPDIDGALVGGASLKADDFSRIIRFKE